MNAQLVYSYEVSLTAWNEQAQVEQLEGEPELKWIRARTAEVAHVDKKQNGELQRYINKHIVINGIGLVAATGALVASAFVHSWYAIAITLVLTYGFMEMLITVLVDKHTSIK
jgi:hypothetical protein